MSYKRLNGLIYVLKSANSWKQTPIFFKIDFPRFFNIFNFYKEQMTSNEVSWTAAILISGSRIQNEAQTDLA